MRFSCRRIQPINFCYSDTLVGNIGYLFNAIVRVKYEVPIGSALASKTTRKEARITFLHVAH